MNEFGKEKGDILEVKEGNEKGLVGVYVGRTAFILDEYKDEVREIRGYLVIEKSSNVLGYKIHNLTRDEFYKTEKVYEELFATDRDKLKDLKNTYTIYKRKEEELGKIYNKDEDRVFHANIAILNKLEDIHEELREIKDKLK